MKIKPRFSFHYVAYTILIFAVVFSFINLVTATTPNPGHPWSELGDGVFSFSNGQTATAYTYTYPAANSTVLTTNTAVTVGQGGTGVGTLTGVVIGNGTSNMSAVVLGANQSIRRNSGDTAYEAFTPLSSLSGAVLTSQSTPQTIGDTTNRLSKLWATDLTVTNQINGSISGSAASAGSVTNATLTTSLTNNGGAGTLTWPAAGATLTIPTGGGTLGSAAFTASTAYQAAAAALTSIAGLSWASGSPLVKMTAAGTFGLDTNTYLTSVTAHNLLSSTHGDTATGTVARGDIMFGNSTPKWDRLVFPTTPTGKILQATATDVVWSTNPITIGASASVSGSNTGDQTKIANLTGGNNTTLLGSIPYQSALDTTTLLSPNTTAGIMYLSMTGTGTNGAAPAWSTITGGGDMTLSGIQTITGAKTFGTIGGAVGKLILAGSTSGSTILNAAAAAGSGTVVLPTTGTLATLAGSEAFTNKSVNGVTLSASAGSTNFLAGDGTYKAVSGSVGANSLDFTELKDALTLDASTSIAFGASTFGLTFTNNGTGNEIHNLTSTGDFIIQDAGTQAFSVLDTGTVQIGVGSGTNTPGLLVLDSKNTTGDPTGVNGAMYYNSNSNDFRCYINGAWANCGANQDIMQLSSQTEPTTPETGILDVYAKSVAGRMMLKMKGPSGLDTPLQPAIFQNSLWLVQPNTTTSVSAVGGSVISTGTLSTITPGTSTFGLATNFASAATANATAGTGQAILPLNTSGGIASNGGFFLVERLFWPDANYGSGATGARFFIGVTSNTFATEIISNNATGSRMGFAYSTSLSETNFMLTTRDGTTETRVSTGVAFVVNHLYDFFLFFPPGSSTLYWRIDDLTAATSTTGSTSSTLPATTTYMRGGFQISTLTTTARNVRMKKIYIETDN